MKKTLFAAIALFSMTACNVQVIETPSTDEYGYISLGISSETEIVTTKADEVDLSSYSINLTKDGNTVSGWPKEYSSITAEDWKVPAGSYSVTATNLEISEAYTDKGLVRVSGSANVTVTAGSESSCTIACTPINSKVSFKYTDGFIKVFPTINNVSIVDGERTVNFTPAKENTEKGNLDAAYFEPKTLTWNLTATKSNDSQKNYSGSITTEANKWSIVTFGVSSENGQISITITVNDEITTVISESIEIDPFKDEQ